MDLKSTRVVPSSTTSGIRGTNLLLGVLVVLLLLSGVLVLRIPSPASRLDQVEAPVVLSSSSVAETRTTAKVSVDVRSYLPVPSPFQDGIVTASWVAPGSVLTTGTRILSVNGVARIACFSPGPFFRDLNVGDSGGDVDALADALVRLGRLPIGAHKRGSNLDGAMAAALRRLAERLGVPVAALPSGASQFQPSWFVWIPAASVQVGSVAATVGAPAPPLGSALLGLRPEVVSATLEGATELAAGTASAVTVQVSGLSDPVPIRNNSLVLTEESRQSLAKTIFGSSAGDAGGQPAPSWGPHVLDGVRTIEWSVRPMTVPVAAIVAAGPRPCVVLQVTGGFEAARLSVVASDPATASAIVTGLPRGARVVANPWASDLARYCRSA